MLRAWSIAAVLVVQPLAANAAEEMAAPRITLASVDWTAVKTELAAAAAVRTFGAAADLGFDDGELARANAITGQRFPGVARSGVPVLLPLGADPAGGAETYSGFRTHMFSADPEGYDAAFALRPADFSELGSRFRDDVYVSVSGSSLLYELTRPIPDTGSPVKELQGEFPGIRRQWLENYLRYTFVRYGVPYVVSTLCHEGAARARIPSCRDADKILSKFVKALRLAGGTPQNVNVVAETIARPAETSDSFTYNPPGRLIQNSGFRDNDGRVDYTVYANIRFPLAQAPAFANSQSFLNWGDCDHTGRTSSPQQKGAPYRCRVNDKPLVFDESAAENRSYPWRDNFCEHRWFFVAQCPGGAGHQGQDIRPGTCTLRNEGADRCQPYQDSVVAVRDGVIYRPPGREAVYLIVNAPGEHIRFRYLHMNPKMLDRDGVVSGRVVRQGEVIGKVGNYDKRENGTTYHLHFDAQVLTKDGWVFVNPYMTLVAAYERLIGARGTEVKDEMVARLGPDSQTPATDGTLTGTDPPRAMLASTDKLDRIAEAATLAVPRTEHAKSAAACPQKLSARHGKRSCALGVASRKRAKHARIVRKMGHHVSHASHRTRRVGSNLHAGDEQPDAGHLSLRAAE